MKKLTMTEISNIIRTVNERQLTKYCDKWFQEDEVRAEVLKEIETKVKQEPQISRQEFMRDLLVEVETLKILNLAGCSTYREDVRKEFTLKLIYAFEGEL